MTGKSIDFLRKRDRDKPFFMMTSYVRPHAPLDAPQCFFDMYKDKALRPPAKGDWNRIGMGGRNKIHDSCSASRDAELIRQQQVGYYDCITHIDHQIGRIISELDNQDVLEDTVIIFTSDHGDQLANHGLNRKAFPYQGSVQIPIVSVVQISM